jgi:hypothetical protein
MLERFVELVREYQMRLKEAVSLFQKHKDLEKPEYWRLVGLPQSGFIDAEGKIKYFFHGKGCRVQLLSGEIDWDFGHDGRIDGFGGWFLWKFAKDGINNFPEFKDKDFYDEVFNEALTKGVIHRPYQHLNDYLYYLRD